jgi:hypothetical protein
VNNVKRAISVARRYASEQLEQAFWDFDALHKSNYLEVDPSLPGPMAEREAFKAVVQNLLSHQEGRRTKAYGPMNYGRVVHVSPENARKATSIVSESRKEVEALIKKFLASRKFPTKAIQDFEDPVMKAFRTFKESLHEAYYALQFSPEDPQSRELFNALLKAEDLVVKFGRDSLEDLRSSLSRVPDGVDIASAFKAEKVKWAKSAISAIEVGLEALEAYSDYGQKLPKKQLDPNPESVEEFSIGSVRCVVVDPKATESDIRSFASYMNEARRVLESHGVGKVWYGLVYFSPSYSEMSDATRRIYEMHGYNIGSSAGVFHTGEDTIAITSPPGPWIVRTMVHEAGHRYWFKFLSAGQRARYESFLEGTFSQLHALLLNADRLSEMDAEWVSGKYKHYQFGGSLSNSDRLKVEALFSDLGLRAGLKPVSEYAKSNVTEAFAEHFEQYILGKTSREHSEFMRTMLASDDAHLSRKVAYRFKVASTLGDDLVRRMDGLFSSPSDEEAGQVAEWFKDIFRFDSPKTPKGQKDLKDAASKLHWFLRDAAPKKDYQGNPIPGNERSIGSAESVWTQDVKLRVEDLVRYFSDEGGKVVPKELKLGGNTYLNLAGFDEKKLKEYATRLETIFASLRGWRTKAVAGGFTVALASPREFRGTSSGTYKSAQDTLYVKATPDVLKRGGGTYASFEYILVHEIGHRWEYKNRVPTDFERPEWYTTQYSRKEGEAFAELFALGHFDIKGSWDQAVVERFEKVMTGE